MSNNLTTAKTIGIVLEVDAIKMYALPIGTIKSEECKDRKLCKIFDSFKGSSDDIKEFQTDVDVNDTIIWQLEVDDKSMKKGYSAYIKGIYGENKKLLNDNTRGRYNGVVKGTVKSDFKPGDITYYHISFYLFLNGKGKRYYSIDPKLKGRGSTLILFPKK